MAKEKTTHRVKHLITLGSSGAGSAVGGTIGFLIGGPVGGVVGGVVGAVSKELLKTLGDIVHRRLSDREEFRIATAAFLATEDIRRRIEAGDLVRDDGLFGLEDQESRSDAQEIFEGMLLKSKDEHQEKKLKFIANIFTNTTFSSDISASEANHVLQVAENLTYRQICFMAIFERKSELIDIHLADREEDGLDHPPILKDISALQEIYQLYQSGIVRLRIDSGSNQTGEAQIIVRGSYLSFEDLEEIVPNRMELSDMGKRYYSIMGLSEMTVEQLADAAVILVG